jgi:hypothetical protein
MRSTVDSLLLWKLIQKFKFNHFLEIGVHQGMTSGLFLESSIDGSVVGIEPYPKLDLFYQHYSQYSDKFTLIENISQSVTASGKYDFILFDGNKDYDVLKQDLDKWLPCLDRSGILAINCDKGQSGPLEILDDLYTLKTDWVPFMRLPQCMLCHHISSDHSEFLDSLFDDLISNFIFVNNETNKFGDVILTCKTLRIFTDFLEYFDLALKHYDI